MPRVDRNHPLPDRRLYIVATILAHLMPRISPDTRWRERFVQLIDSEPAAPLAAMGFPRGWRDQTQWQNL